MDIYETWLYEYVINTRWFLWTVFATLFGLNVFSWVLLWFLLSGKSLRKAKSVKAVKSISEP